MVAGEAGRRLRGRRPGRAARARRRPARHGHAGGRRDRGAAPDPGGRGRARAWSCSRASPPTTACSTRCARAPPATCSRTRSRPSCSPRSASAHSGGSPLHPEAAARARRRAARARPTAAVELTAREREVLELIARGMPNKAIALRALAVGEDRQGARLGDPAQARRHRPHPGGAPRGARAAGRHRGRLTAHQTGSDPFWCTLHGGTRGGVAQGIEQQPSKLTVAGSNPAAPASCAHAQVRVSLD